MPHTTQDGTPAFPHTVLLADGSAEYSVGMRLRDWFAGQAAAGITSGYWGNPEMSGLSPIDLAQEAYALADAMMEARK